MNSHDDLILTEDELEFIFNENSPPEKLTHSVIKSPLSKPEINFLSQSYEENFDAFEYFSIYNDLYFESKLGPVKLEWSKRMTYCAGIFSVTQGVPVIRLSEPLLKFRSIKETKETLLHEMIHAFCHIMNYDQSDDLSGHGRYFKMKMREINKLTNLNITVYHSFHNEVDFYRKHVWRCNGKCQDFPPYYGYVKRAMNRKPGKSDNWWDDHQKSCGGEFIKISEVNNNTNKPKKENKSIKIKIKKENQTPINTLDNFVKMVKKKKN